MRILDVFLLERPAGIADLFDYHLERNILIIRMDPDFLELFEDHVFMVDPFKATRSISSKK